MAIDTENKRRAVSSTRRVRLVGPVPDASLASKEDRRHIAGGFRFASVGAIAATVAHYMRMRRQ